MSRRGSLSSLDAARSGVLASDRSRAISRINSERVYKASLPSLFIFAVCINVARKGSPPPCRCNVTTPILTPPNSPESLPSVINSPRDRPINERGVSPSQPASVPLQRSMRPSESADKNPTGIKSKISCNTVISRCSSA